MPSVLQIINVVVICDDFVGAVYALEAIESIRLCLGPNTLIQSSYWRFDRLNALDPTDPSLEAVANADLLIVSTSNSSTPLMANVRWWTMVALRECSGSLPVIAAFHPAAEDSSGEESPMCEFLSGIATRWNADFLCNASFDTRLAAGLAFELLEYHRNKRSNFDRANFASSFTSGFGWGIPA